MLEKEEIKYMEEHIIWSISSIQISYSRYLNDLGSKPKKGLFGVQNKSIFSSYSPDNTILGSIYLSKQLETLYYLIITYFEARGMHNLLQTFKTKFENTIANCLIITPVPIDEDYTILHTINSFKQFLEPFKFFDYNQIKTDETKRLISVLGNTGFILKNINAKISNEADIYNQIKWILSLYYPTCRNKNKAAFIQQFKTYSPDLLIPELKAAIEFKYIKSNGIIDNFLDQLMVDAVNYNGDESYERFIAVIFIENIAIATPESIKEAWKQKGFPDNWQLVITGHQIKSLKN